MKRFTWKKKLVAGAAVVALAAGATAAFAYWTSAGSGSGTGTAALSNGDSLTLHGTFPADTLEPGGQASISFTADNSSATEDAGVTTIVASNIQATGGCDASAFHIADTPENEIVPAGASAYALATDGTITMDNTSANQDNCKGATISFDLASAAG